MGFQNPFESFGILVPSTSSDPYAWGDLVPACHPLLEEHHSPIDLDGQMSRNRSLDSLHLEGFEDIQTGHWVLQNDGHSGKRRFGPLNTCGFWVKMGLFVFQSSCRSGAACR